MSNEVIDVKIGTPIEAKWEKLLKEQEDAILSSRINIEIAESIVSMAKKHIKEEQAK